MQKVTGKWLQTDLTNEILLEELDITLNNFYFTKMLDQSEKPMKTFVMCKLIEIVKFSKFCLNLNFLYLLFFRIMIIIQCNFFNQFKRYLVSLNVMIWLWDVRLVFVARKEQELLLCISQKQLCYLKLIHPFYLNLLMCSGWQVLLALNH